MFIEFMQFQEGYMQKSFQYNHDEKAAGDYTHKYSKLIKALIRSEDIFTASYTTISLLGYITTSHLTFTK